MADISVQQALSKYKSYMQEVKYRTQVISRVLDKYKAAESLTGYRESDVELCLLQLRKCLELVMYASLVAHFHSGVALQKHLFESEWNATKILAFLKRVNPGGFPKALRRISKEGQEIDDMEEVPGALTLTEFGQLYDRVCGKYLHASRSANILSDHASLFGEIEVWFKKLTLLLNSHWVDVTGDIVFAVLMQNNVDGDVQVVLFEKQDRK